MIYISSSCIKKNKISDCVNELAINGFKNIELSGGTNYYPHLKTDLLKLKSELKTNFLCHNYFPPPTEHFVLNLASLDNSLFEKTVNHYLESIKLTRELGATKFGIHAGFFLDFSTKEIGGEIKQNVIQKEEEALKRFCHGFTILKQQASEIELYIENNVINAANLANFNGKNFMMLCNAADYLRLKEKIDFSLLLDIAHLKVSCHTLNLDFDEELQFLLTKTDYIHLSDNNLLTDSNQTLKQDSRLFKILATQKLTNKTITLEIYDTIEHIKEAYSLIGKLI